MKLKVNEEVKSKTNIIIIIIIVVFTNAIDYHAKILANSLAEMDRTLMYNIIIYDNTPYRLLVIIEKISR